MDINALTVLTVVHVTISLVGIATGFVVAYGLLASRRFDRCTLIFLATTIATSATGFLFPLHGFTPAIGFGILSLLILPLAVYARYGRRLMGHWRWAYIVTAMVALYLNTVVLVVQSFLKIPALNALAPNQNEPPFAIAQGFLFVLFIVLTVLAIRGFHINSQGIPPLPARPA